MPAPFLLFLFTLTAAAGYGAWLLRALRIPPGKEVLAWITAAALGLGSTAYLILALGLLGLLRPAALGGIVAGGVLLVVAHLLVERGQPVAGPGAWRSTLPEASGESRERIGSRALGVLLVGAALMSLVGVFRPVESLDWDGLSYHLAAPKIYLREGRIPFLAYDSHTHFPFTMEMLYTLGLQFGSEPGAKLFHWGCGWLTAAAIGVWSARLGWEGQRVPAWVGPLAAALFITMPVVLWELGTSYVDLGTALFQFLALVLLLESVERDGTGWRLRTPGLAAAAGVLSGFALGTKYTALLQFGLLGIGLLCGLLRSPPLARAGWLRGLLWFGGLGVVVGAPWYVKNWLWVHNPVYPFFFSLFPQSFSWTRHAEIAYQTEQRSFGMGRDLGAALGLFWNLGLHARDFYANLRTLAGDRFGSVGVAWAAAAPLLVWIPLRRWPWPARACLAYAVGSLAAWFLLSHQIRYLIPVFAPLAVVTALLPVLLPGSLLRGSLAACLGASLLLNVKMHQELFQDSLRVVTGQVSREQFLDAYLPGLYEASRYVNGLPTNVRVALYQETRGYYFDRRYFWANPLQHNWIPYDTLPNGRALAGQLRRFGITHVLINYDFCRGVEGASWYRLVMDGVRSGVFRESFRSRVGEPERRGVFIYELEPAS